jgi:hypothetical protein
MIDNELPAISDDYMRQTLPTARVYTLVILKKTPKRAEPGADQIIWEHGRRNFALRNYGIMPVVCPVRDDSEVGGICIFTTGLEETKEIMDADPGVRAGVLVYELHACRGFPGSILPS